MSILVTSILFLGLRNSSQSYKHRYWTHTELLITCSKRLQQAIQWFVTIVTIERPHLHLLIVSMSGEEVRDDYLFGLTVTGRLLADLVCL